MKTPNKMNVPSDDQKFGTDERRRMMSSKEFVNALMNDDNIRSRNSI